MLQLIRTRAGSVIVKGLFALLILSFGFWGIYTRSDYYSSRSPDTVVATVGDQSIRADELQRSLESALQRLRAQTGSAIEPQQAKQLGILDTLLGQLVDRSLLDQEAAQLRLEVSDDIVRSAIYDNPAFRGVDGKFDRNLFAQVLTMNQLSEDQLVARLRRDIPRSDLLQALTVGVVAPRSIADALYRYRNEKRVAELVAFPASAIADIGPPSDDDLNKFYESHQDMFRAPEYRKFTIVSLDPAEAAKGIEIPEDRLRKEYDSRKDEFATQEQREVEQILAPNEDKAKEAAAALAAGKDWKEVATTIAGQDPDTIDLGLLARNEMPRELADIAFELPLNKPSDPIKTPLGWHILRVTKIDPPTQQSFEQVKDQLANELARDEAADRLDRLVTQVDDALAGGASIADVASKFGLKTTEIAASDVSGRDPDGKPVAIPVSPAEVVKTAFDARANETSRTVQTQDGAIFVVHVDEITPARVRPLAEVKDKATAAWQGDQKHQAAVKEAEALAAAVTPGTSLAAVAAEKKLTVSTSPPLTRRQDQKSTVPPVLLGKLFTAKQGDIVTIDDASGAYVAQLKEIQTPQAPADGAPSALQNELGSAMRTDIASEFTEALRNRFSVDIKQAAIDRMF
jgi:peptidyl-prolyl cis-trans isomerase D